MLYEILLTVYIAVAFLLVLIIMIQQSKSSAGIGAFGGGAQMLFGGSGGQDILQKTTWALGAIFMGLSLLLALMRAGYQPFKTKQKATAPIEQRMPQETPANDAADTEKGAK